MVLRGIERTLRTLVVPLGLALLLLPGPAAARESMVVQSDGKVVLGGSDLLGYGTLVRYHPDGSLDLGFGKRGIVVDRRARSFELLDLPPEGGVLAAAPRTATGGPVLARFAADGSSEAGFGQSGLASSPAPAGFATSPVGIARRPDGQMVVAFNHCCDKYSQSPPASLQLFGPSGAFGGAYLGLGGEPPGSFRLGKVNALVRQPDGSVVAIGTGTAAGEALAAVPRQAMLRFGPVGAYDSSFRAGEGPPLGAEASPVQVATGDPAGRIVTAGVEGNGAIVLSRYGADGRLDASFGEGGKDVGLGRTKLPVPDSIQLRVDALAVEGNSDVLVLATLLSINSPGLDGTHPCGGCGQLLLARFGPDGRLDPTFGQGGTVRIGEGPGGRAPMLGRSVAALPDGRILVSATRPWETRPFILARFTDRGELDPAFGEGGVVVTETCPALEDQQRQAGCLPAARVKLTVKDLAGPRPPQLRLRVRPSVPWAGIVALHLRLPDELGLRPGGTGPLKGVRVGRGGRRGQPRIYPHSLGATRLGFARSVTATLWGGAIRRLGEIPPGRKLEFEVGVWFADVGQSQGDQRLHLRRGG